MIFKLIFQKNSSSKLFTYVPSIISKFAIFLNIKLESLKFKFPWKKFILKFKS